ncbi:MAG: relaxase/mobilization nuclease domain-containing protein [Alphaproteobacteria bacterium]
MIFYASQRENAAELANHLLNGDENDHVTIHEIRGFVSETLAGAMREAEAMSRGTRCKQFLFSVSLNPPEDADVPIEEFEAAIEEIERRLHLIGQPRIVVFHEKNGRRHCHAVWSRINTEKLVAVNMAHFKRKLMDLSRGLFFKYGWKMPDGMKKGQPRSPWHMTREEHRQAVRLAQDPQALKAMFKGAWEQSDSKETFARALQERGFLLARGDSRGFVALDVTGGTYSLTRWLDIGTRDLKARLGLPEKLPDIASAKTFLAERMGENLQRYIAESKQRAKEIRQPLVQEIRALVAVQRKERTAIIERQQKRWVQETKTRAARLPRGFKGIWHKATGEYKKVRAVNEAETKTALERDRKELHALVRSHLLERQELQKTVKTYKEEHKAEALRIRQEIARYVSTATEPPALQSVKPVETVPVAVQLAAVETKIALLSGDLSMLQSALESNLISDEMRGAIRRMIERTLETLHIKAAEEKEYKEKRQEKEIVEKQAQLNEYIRRYAELQVRAEENKRRQEANRQFYAVVMNMGYALNGVPRWPIAVMSPPPEKRLDERVFTATLRQKPNNELLYTVTRPYVRPPVNPPMATVNLRTSVLETKELLRRAGLRTDDGSPNVKPTQTIPMAATTAVPKASARFNARR